jgi:hypothetical protein
MNFQTGSDHPIAIGLGIKSQFFPDRLDKFPNQVRPLNGGLTSFKPQVSPTVWKNFQDKLKIFYIAGLTRVPSLNKAGPRPNP